MLTDRFGTDSNAMAREIRRKTIGDISMTPKQIDAVSPIKHVDLIKRPLLIAHGTWDARVPVEQSERLVRLLHDQGSTVQWIPFPKERHGLSKIDNRVRYYTAVLGFLGKCIGPASALTAQQSASGVSSQ